MCGICGIINFNKRRVEEEKLRSMMEPIRHRGPDDEGVYTSDSIGFGFRRLSILDLTKAGHQPMHDKSERFTIIFNGEIYNYVELKKQLSNKGYSFKSKTDSEVLLNAFIEWDSKCLNKLNGMFAFAIYDKRKKRTFIARDRFGIKPLYYCREDGRFIFGSEIPSLLTVLNNKEIKPNEKSIFNYLAFNRTDATEDTFFANIKKLQHGHFIDIQNAEFNIKQWYKLTEKLDNPFNNAEEYREALSSSVGLRLRSDVPVGACLSGGLDSSSIVSILINDYQKYDLNTFSAVYGRGKKGDESEFINVFKKDLSNMYNTTPTAKSLINDLDNFLIAHAEPISTTSPYAQFKVMELAKEHVVVTLDGQGADEQLAGYHYLFGNYFKELVIGLSLIRLVKEGYSYSKVHQSSYALKTFLFFLLPKQFKTRIFSRSKGYLNSSFTNRNSADNVIASQLYNTNSLREAHLNHFEYKLEHLLKWDDRNSMWFSLESRVPFLDHRLVERTLSLSSEQIINNGVTKQILRKAMKGTLPDKIRERQDKVGFATTEEEWFREEPFKSFINRLIHSQTFRERGYFNPEKVAKLYKKHIKGEINISKDIWKWINLELWFRKYINFG